MEIMYKNPMSIMNLRIDSLAQARQAPRIIKFEYSTII
jgi:hypothetical protein